VALLDCLAEWMTVPGYQQRFGGSALARSGMHHAAIVPYGPYRTADGTVTLGVQNSAQWQRFCRVVLQREGLADDPRFATNEARVRNRHRLEAVIEECLAGATADEVEGRLAAADVPFGRYNDVAGLIGHAQLAARSRWWDIPLPSGGSAPGVRPPFNIDGMPRFAGAVPALGEHTAEVLEEIR
jgi:crotonobetainyl-CoA:carnitine CoA-transferase CaiB-like acyl-CoA transferase